MLELMNLATPRGRWLKTLSEDFDRATPIAHALLAEEHSAHEEDARDELISEWFRRHPQAVTDAAMLCALGQDDDARKALRASLSTFLRLAPEWEVAGLRTPTRRQVLRQWGSTSHDVDLAATVDGFDAATRREVARKHCKEGKALPPRAPDDDGGLVSHVRRHAVVGTVERGGIPIQKVRLVEEDDAGNVTVVEPPVRPTSRVQIGNDPHPRFLNAEAQEPTSQ